jgi:hypothetical protein
LFLKALTGTTWGQQKETLVMTYKAIARIVGEYAVPLWGKTTKPSSWKKISTAENEALQIATGCVRMTEIDHLHLETNMLPIQQHANMVSQQYALVCHKPCLHSFKHTTMEQAP